LKEEVVNEAKVLGKNIPFTNLSPQQQDLLEVKEETSAKSLMDGKKKIVKFIMDNDIMENSQESSQTPVLDKNETINISENQASDLSSSTNITGTEKQTDNNLVSRTESLPAKDTPPPSETDGDKYEGL
jgi:hypothetical protein